MNTHVLPPFSREIPPCPPCHWMIDLAEGPTSLGVCKNCGDRKEFKNNIPDLTWESGRVVDIETLRGRSDYMKGYRSLST